MNFKFRVFTAVVTLALLTIAVSASAEIVFLKSGRTLSVRSHRVDGERITLTLRGGGEVTCDKTVVDKIEPDEVRSAGSLSARRRALR